MKYLVLTSLTSCAIASQAMAFSVTAFTRSELAAMTNAELGISGYAIESFEDAALLSGLEIEYSDAITAAANIGPTNILPATFNPAVDDINVGQVFIGSAWDGAHSLVNRNLSVTPIPLNYEDFNWTDLTFHFTTPVDSVGFTIHNLHLSAPVSINGGEFSTSLETHLPYSADLNGFIRFDAGVGELIHTLRISNTAHAFSGDGFALDYFAFNAVVPVPPAIWLFGTALGILAWMRRKST